MVRRQLKSPTWLGAIVIVFAMSAPSPAQVNSNAGTSGYSFLKIPQNARLVALGGASVAEASDAAAMQINPAGLAQQRNRTWSATYSNLFTDVQSGFLSYTQAIEDETVFGIALTYLSSTGIPRRDNLNNDLGTFGFSDLALSVAVGTRLVGGPDTLSAEMRRRLRVREFRLDGGVTVKGIYEKLDSFSSSGIAVDLGLLAHMPDDRTRVGVSLLHAGTQTSGYIDEKDPLPLTFVAGVRHRLREAPLMVTADVRAPKDNKARFGVGGEVNLGAGRDRPAPLAIRAGYNSQGRDLRTAAEQSGIAGFSFGLGVQWRLYKLDYSYTPGLGLGTLHRFTLSGQIGS
jgi:hypothetical protein